MSPLGFLPKVCNLVQMEIIVESSRGSPGAARRWMWEDAGASRTSPPPGARGGRVKPENSPPFPVAGLQPLDSHSSRWGGSGGDGGWKQEKQSGEEDGAGSPGPKAGPGCLPGQQEDKL